MQFSYTLFSECADPLTHSELFTNMYRMSKEMAQNGNGKHLESRTSSVDAEDSDLLNRPSPVNTERIRSFDLMESLGSPRSNSCFNTHPMFGEAWNALRRSLVYFRGQAVGTVAARDHSSEELNYNQVKYYYSLNSSVMHTHKFLIACYLSSKRLHR